ncbi:MAG: hypothetical protein VW455_10555 [Nitrospinota bacterium]
MIQELVSDFWLNGKDLKEEGTFRAALNLLLKEVRTMLDSSSQLAKSIDRGDSHKVMAKFATEEGYGDLAEILQVGEDEKEKTIM